MAKEKKINSRALLDEAQSNRERCGQISERLTALADVVRNEKRELNKDETDEQKALSRELNSLLLREQAIQGEMVAIRQLDKEDALASQYPTIRLRELMDSNQKTTIVLQREVTPATTAALANTGVIPIAQQEIMKPLRSGLIWDKVGINVHTGLVGSLRWPSHSKAVAQWADEAEVLVDKSIDYSKLEMSGTRLGIAIPVTREQLYNSEGIVEQVINEEMPQAISDAINKAVFALEVPGKAPKGPFVDLVAAADAAPIDMSTPSKAFKALAKIKANLLATGITPKALCWVMSFAQKADFETTPRDAGSGIMLCESDHILGLPVFCTQEMGEGYVGLGDFSYLAAGFFGNLQFIVDPYTLARKNSVDFVLNNNFGMVALRPEAFKLTKITPAV